MIEQPEAAPPRSMAMRRSRRARQQRPSVVEAEVQRRQGDDQTPSGPAIPKPAPKQRRRIVGFPCLVPYRAASNKLVTLSRPRSPARARCVSTLCRMRSSTSR